MSDSKHDYDDSIMSLNEKGGKIKRPMNAFMLWSKQRRREISKDDPTIHNAQISKLLGEEWKDLPVEDKQPFLKESQKLMVKHKKEHPDYRYKPRKNKQEKGRYSTSIGKPCHTPSQAKSYSKYDNFYRYRSPSYHYQDDVTHRMSNMSKHRPILYYQRYTSECHIPGCYECEYPRPYEQSRDIYCCPNDPPQECHSTKHHCLCCSPSPSFVPRATRTPSTKSFSKSKSFTVESLIHQDESETHHRHHHHYPYNHHYHSPGHSSSSHSSSTSPASTSPTRELKRECSIQGDQSEG